MSLNLDNGWQVLPIDGDTGTAFMGVNHDQRLFIKQNSSPFLAALSLEQIVPRLVWTKTMSTGDTLTAQEWQNGRSLKRTEMQKKEVSDLLYRLHHSDLLKRMLLQIGGQVLPPQELLNRYFRGLAPDLRKHPLLKNTANHLRACQPKLERSNYEVCHGDLNHKNWLLSDKHKLYLVDWEAAMIADPATDLSMLMCQYVPREQWYAWLCQYVKGTPTAELCQRVDWYLRLYLLMSIKHSYMRGRFHEMNQDIVKLNEFSNKKLSNGKG